MKLRHSTGLRRCCSHVRYGPSPQNSSTTPTSVGHPTNQAHIASDSVGSRRVGESLWSPLERFASGQPLPRAPPLASKSMGETTDLHPNEVERGLRYGGIKT